MRPLRASVLRRVGLLLPRQAGRQAGRDGRMEAGCCRSCCCCCCCCAKLLMWGRMHGERERDRERERERESEREKRRVGGRDVHYPDMAVKGTPTQMFHGTAWCCHQMEAETGLPPRTHGAPCFGILETVFGTPEDGESARARASRGTFAMTAYRFVGGYARARARGHPRQSDGCDDSGRFHLVATKPSCSCKLRHSDWQHSAHMKHICERQMKWWRVSFAPQ